MAHNDLDNHLRECGKLLPDQITPIMRSRFDETYDLIRREHQAAATPEIAAANNSKGTKKLKPLQKAGITAAAAVILGVAAASSALISPTMAESLQKMPIIGNIFKLAGDFGLQKAEEQGLATTVNQSASHDGYTITATKVSYDGIRIALELTRTAPEGTKEALYHLRSIMNDTAGKGTFNNIAVALPSGRYGSLSLGTDLITEPSESVLVQIENLSGEIPDQFDLSVKMGLRGYKQPFELKVPVTKMAGNDVLTANETKTHNGIGLKLTTIEMTPITTRITVKLMDKSLPLDMSPYFDIVDDQDNFPKPLSSMRHEEEHTVASTYEAFRSKPKSITVKPYIYAPDKKYIPELEFTIPVP
ncbi:DUF4179 domain-containing protein [Paenibacillus sp. GCM10027626]|uniref:DUF4179 domain-containing protein n=1 Tax=Paenibacillus sp. GCM10027626 TaxID=3273411 RepID=UPI0036374212